MQTVIQFSPDGSGLALHTDAINLASIGTLTVKRASMVEFSNTRQQWQVRIGRTVRFSNASRAQCLTWERQHFNRILTEGKTH